MSLGAWRTRDTLNILMEYADGGDLEGVIKNQGRQLMLESEALYFFVQICFALKFLHDKNVIHRDLKPQNIFLSERRRVLKLGDFGFAEHESALAESYAGEARGDLRGTPLHARMRQGGYSEAIQFQCLERGGVRIFEGINFLTRSPTMSAERLAAMHARADGHRRDLNPLRLPTHPRRAGARRRLALRLGRRLGRLFWRLSWAAGVSARKSR